MSQKVKIIDVKIKNSAIYVGKRDDVDVYSMSPDEVMNWLCDGYRTRFNQHRSKRCKYDGSGNLTPIGHDVINISDSQARSKYSFLSAIPAMILQAPEKKENTEWFSAAQRKKTSGGSMPRFLSGKRSDQFFVCWYNNGSNAVFEKTGRRTGIVTIKGKNPPGKKLNKASPSRWVIRIRVRVTQEIRNYTSILVNWTKKTIVFTNVPKPINAPLNNDAVGVDRGGRIAIATSDSEMFSPDKKIVQKYENKHKYYQRKMAKARERARKKDKELGNTNNEELKSVMSGSSYKNNKLKSARYYQKLSRYRKAWVQEITTQLVKKYGVVVLEDLKVKNMTRRSGAKKRGVNRSFLQSSPSDIAEKLEYKSMLHGNRIVYLPPHYTSQRCHSCGYTSKENRESQSVFLCKKCSHTTNADTNAAKNLVALYNRIIEGTDLPAYSCNDYKNGSGEIIRPKIPKELKEEFFLHGSLNDAIDPSSCTLV